MNDEKRLKAYAAMAETTRRWVTIMDAKAAFMSTLNAGLLTFAWTAAKLVGEENCSYYFALFATGASFLSLLAALRVVLPRFTFKNMAGHGSGLKDSVKPISFYGFVAQNYSPDSYGKFIKDVEKMDEGALAREALDQHFTTSHVAQYKANLLLLSGGLFFLALILTLIALAVRQMS